MWTGTPKDMGTLGNILLGCRIYKEGIKMKCWLCHDTGQVVIEEQYTDIQGEVQFQNEVFKEPCPHCQKNVFREVQSNAPYLEALK